MFKSILRFNGYQQIFLHSNKIKGKNSSSLWNEGIKKSKCLLNIAQGHHYHYHSNLTSTTFTPKSKHKTTFKLPSYNYRLPFRIESRPIMSSSNTVSSEILTNTLSSPTSSSLVHCLTLNRPKALNALSASMILQMTDIIKRWDEDPQVKLIFLRGNGRAFCAGGDVKALVQEMKDNKESGRDNALMFFEKEYVLDHLIATADTPIISILDGICMGGGVGISIHAPIRIATENSVFSMPETAIGLFPDVGSSFFLPRLNHLNVPGTGEWLGLCGERIFGRDLLLSGIATHFVQSHKIEDLVKSLSLLNAYTMNDIVSLINEFSEPITEKEYKEWEGIGSNQDAISRCFSKPKLEDILEALKQEKSEFGERTLKKLNQMSPVSLQVTLEAIRRGEKMDLASCFEMEYQLTKRFTAQNDFSNGVTSILISKPSTQPQWSHSLETLNETFPLELMKQTYFNDTPSSSSQSHSHSHSLSSSLTGRAEKISSTNTHQNEHLSFIYSRTYEDYPHRSYFGNGLGREDVRQVVCGEISETGVYVMTPQEVIDW